MKKELLLVIASILLFCACDKKEVYNYQIQYESGGTYTQWFMWRSVFGSLYDVGIISAIDGLVLIGITKDSPYIPTTSLVGTGNFEHVHDPHYELVAKFKFEYSEIQYRSCIIDKVSEWKYAYGQFEDMNGKTIFRIIELYDEIPE